MPVCVCRKQKPPAWAVELAWYTAEHLHRLERIMATQEDIDALTARLVAADERLDKGLAEIKGEIANLSAAGVDTSALETAVASIENDAAESDDVVPDAPVEEPAPEAPAE